jgi:hypothetical protein
MIQRLCAVRPIWDTLRPMFGETSGWAFMVPFVAEVHPRSGSDLVCRRGGRRRFWGDVLYVLWPPIGGAYRNLQVTEISKISMMLCIAATGPIWWQHRLT